MATGKMVCKACSDAAGMNCGPGGKCDAYKGCFKCPAKWSLVSNSTGKYSKRMTCQECSKVSANAVMCTKSKVLGCDTGFALSEDGASCAKINDGGLKNVDVTNCQVAQIYTDKA